jgi:hypothetical protein
MAPKRKDPAAVRLGRRGRACRAGSGAARDTEHPRPGDALAGLLGEFGEPEGAVTNPPSGSSKCPSTHQPPVLPDTAIVYPFASAVNGEKRVPSTSRWSGLEEIGLVIQGRPIPSRWKGQEERLLRSAWMYNRWRQGGRPLCLVHNRFTEGTGGGESGGRGGGSTAHKLASTFLGWSTSGR